MIVLGLDPPAGRNCGYGIVNQDKDDLYVIESGTYVITRYKDDYRKELEDLYLWLKDTIEDHNIEHIAIERSMGGGFAHVRNKLIEFTAMIKLASLHCGVGLTEISPMHAKKVITGSGGKEVTKKMVEGAVLDLFDLNKKDIKTEHEADAIGIAYTYLVDIQAERI